MPVQQKPITSITCNENGFRSQEEQDHTCVRAAELHAIGMTSAATPHRGLNDWPLPDCQSEDILAVLHRGASHDETRQDRKRSFEDAYEKGFGRTAAILRRHTADFSLAEELAQAAWCKAWERLDSLREARCIYSWVNTSAINLLRDYSANSRRFSPLLAAGEPHAMPAVDLASIEIDRALKVLTPRQRQLINAVYMQGLSTDEVALQLNISGGAVHHRLSRARIKMRQCLTVG